ncbi:unnamed protein product, partial [Rotaria sp. Silwood1]
ISLLQPSTIMSFTCALCCRTKEMKKTEFTTVISIDVEEKIKKAYENIHGIPLSTRIFNQLVHRQCYGKYHRHYTKIFENENKQSSTQIQNCLLTHRLPLADRTNYQIPSSLVLNNNVNVSMFSTKFGK